MRVFSFRRPNDALVEVDVFAESPVPFPDLVARSVAVDVGGRTVQVASLDDLISMKRVAGRTQDLADIEALEVIREARRG